MKPSNKREREGLVNASRLHPKLAAIVQGMTDCEMRKMADILEVWLAQLKQISEPLPNSIMNTCTILKLSTEANPWLGEDANIRKYGEGLRDIATKGGGTGAAFFKDEILSVFIQGVPASTLNQMLTAFEDGVRREGKSVTIVREDNIEVPGGVLLKQTITPGAVVSGRLTRSFLESLPEGCFVVSNLSSPVGSLFAERIGSIRERVMAWRRAKSNGAAGRKCHVAWTEGEFRSLCDMVRGPDGLDN